MLRNKLASNNPGCRYYLLPFQDLTASFAGMNMGTPPTAPAHHTADPNRPPRKNDPPARPPPPNIPATSQAAAAAPTAAAAPAAAAPNPYAGAPGPLPYPTQPGPMPMPYSPYTPMPGNVLISLFKCPFFCIYQCTEIIPNVL